jgi:hypothetical protein
MTSLAHRDLAQRVVVQVTDLQGLYDLAAHFERHGNAFTPRRRREGRDRV